MVSSASFQRVLGYMVLGLAIILLGIIFALLAIHEDLASSSEGTGASLIAAFVAGFLGVLIVALGFGEMVELTRIAVSPPIPPGPPR